MVTKCANSHCSAPFRYWGEGRLYRLDLSEHPKRMQQAGGNRALRSHNVEHFWLCGSCAGHLTLALDQNGEIITIPYDPNRDWLRVA